MIIFRVENSDGRGPFYGVWNLLDVSVYQELATCMDEFFGDYSNHPGPDPSMCEKGSHFACRSLSELAEWFRYDRICEILTQNDFHIKVYKVKTVIRGTNQLSFKKNNARLLHTLPLSRLKGL
jgi:hypothetical protein